MARLQTQTLNGMAAAVAAVQSYQMRNSIMCRSSDDMARLSVCQKLLAALISKPAVELCEGRKCIATCWHCVMLHSCNHMLERIAAAAAAANSITK